MAELTAFYDLEHSPSNVIVRIVDRTGETNGVVYALAVSAENARAAAAELLTVAEKVEQYRENRRVNRNGQA